MKLSIVGTLYRSEEFINEFYTRVVPTAKKITTDYEIIFVNDGSPDNSKEVVLKLQNADSRVTLIDLSRNFGHHKAIMTGLNFATGDYIFLIDTDLEEDPEHLYKLWNVLENDPEVDVVYGIQSKRKGKWFEQSSGSIYYKLIYLVTGQRYPANTLTARVMTKRYVDGLKNFDEKEFDIWTLFVLNGFEQKGITLTKKSKGTSSYTLKRKIRIAIDIVTSFTTMPLYLIALLGVLLFFTSVIYGLYLLFAYLSDWPISPWSVTIAFIWFIGGAIVGALGIISIYLSKMYLEIKNRPMRIIRHIYAPKR